MTNAYLKIIENFYESDKRITDKYNKENKDPMWTNISARLKFTEARLGIVSLALLDLLHELEKNSQTSDDTLP